MIKTHYKSKLDPNLGHNLKNILSYNSKIINDEIPITEISWSFIWYLIKHKFKHKIYFLVINSNNEQSFNWFYLKKK